MAHKNFFNKFSVWFFIAIVAVLFLSFAHRNSSGQGTQNPASTKIEVRVGENAVITLEANHTTGYSWQLARQVDKDMLEFVNTKYVASNTGLIGSGGKEVWTFKTLKAGQTEVFLKYVQPWEKDKPPAREATFVIMVK